MELGASSIRQFNKNELAAVCAQDSLSPCVRACSNMGFMIEVINVIFCELAITWQENAANVKGNTQTTKALNDCNNNIINKIS